MRAPWWLWSVVVGCYGLALPSVQVTLAEAPPRPRQTYGDLFFLGAIATAPLGPRQPELAAADPPRLPILRNIHWMAPPTPLEHVWIETAQKPDELPQRWLPPQLLAMEKPVPHMVTTTVVTPPVATAPVWIRGPARWRALLDRPPLAPYLSRVPLTRLRTREIATRTELDLRFTLTPDGQVGQVDLLRSSGDPLLDLAGLQYLKDWRFAAADQKDLRKQATTWGQVTLQMDLEPSP